MHHKNHKNSTSNHSNPAHQKPAYPSSPAPQKTGKSALARIRERFQTKPATPQEIQQLRLDTVREELKTRKQLAKNKRPSRFTFGGGFQSAPPSYRRSSSRAGPQTGDWLFGNSGGMSGDFLTGGNREGPSLDFITGTNSGRQGRRSSKPQRSGLDDLFT